MPCHGKKSTSFKALMDRKMSSLIAVVDYFAVVKDDSRLEQDLFTFTKDVSSNRVGSCTDDDVYWDTDTLVFDICD